MTKPAGESRAPDDESRAAVSRKHPIVGVGASAGGVEALQQFVRALPTDSGLGFVIVQHLAPDHPSMMEGLLAAHSKVPVRTAEDGMRVDPNIVIVTPPGRDPTMQDGRLRLTESERGTGIRTPIDRFLVSMAEDRGADSYCIILSGTGNDGTAGLRAVKSVGGVAIVQETGNARFPGMPDSAIATGLVDFVLPAERIPARLIDIARHREVMEEASQIELLHGAIEGQLPEICALLADGEEGHDFSRYKPGTLVRRVERRMALLRQRTVEGFIGTLENDSDERARLQQDFLIGVTRFFRDPEAFDALETEVIDSLFRNGADRVRIWVPGCSTGEEVYSLAILCHEACARHGSRAGVQLFGTDIDQAALYFARQGVYPLHSLGAVSAERRERYFTRENDAFAVAQPMRETCIFAPHNVLEDPPFSRLDLVSCRNLLIYLDRRGQERVLSRFHYALKDGGHLFLSPAETLGREEHFFEAVDKPNRIFRRDGSVPHAYSSVSERPPRPRRQGWSGIPPARDRDATPDLPLAKTAEAFFLDRFAAPHAVIDPNGDVVFLSERMTRFVRPSRGETSTKLDDFLLPPLRLPVRSALAELRNGRAWERRDVLIGEGDARQLIAVKAAAMEAGRFMIVLSELAQPEPEVLEAEAEGQTSPVRLRLERELATTRQQLDVTLSEYEISSQELRNTNEELLSMNEEMQSANEELETSREELQSVNEELETMNAELRENNRQLQRANSDLKNLLESTQIATLFLDGQLCVRGFTPEITDLFGVRQRDEGRPLSEIARRFDYDDLTGDAEEVGRTLRPVEREITLDATDQTFIMRIKPYRTVDDRLDGYVLTFFDITERKRAEELLERQRRDLARQYGELKTLYDTTPVGLSLMDRDLRWVRINEQLAAINGFAVEAHIGKRQDELIPDIDRSIAEVQRHVLETGEPAMGFEVRGTTPAEPDRLRDWITDYYPVRSEDGVFAVGCCVREVTDQKELERQLKSSLDRLELAVSHHPIFMAEIDADHCLVWSAGTLDDFPGPNDRGRSVLETLPREIAVQMRASIEAVLADGKARRIDVDLSDDRTFDVSLEPMDASISREGETNSALFLLWFDVTERRWAEDRRVLLLGELQHRVKNTLATVLSIVRFSAASTDNVEVMERALSDRLLAISRTHDLLTSSEWTEVSAETIVRGEVEPYLSSAQAATFAGLDVKLGPRYALALSLAVHELTVNAIKYGALSSPEGRVAVSLERQGGEQLRFAWQESGVPRVDAALERSGFGRFLLEEALPYQVDGEASMVFEPEGLRFTLTFELVDDHRVAT